jgi:hypothetical protein
MAKANDVIMKITVPDGERISSFGKNRDGAVVNGKFEEFITKVNEYRK